MKDLKQIEKLKKQNKLSYRTRNNGLIEIRWYYNNQLKSVYGWTQEEVINKFKQWKPRTKKVINKEKSESMFFEEWYNKWLELYKKPNVSQSTLKSIEYTAKKYFLETFKNIKLENINGTHIQKIVNSAKKFERQKTIIFNYLNQIFSKAQQLKLIKDNPCKQVEFKRVNQINKGIALTIEEETKFTNYLKDTKNKYKNLFLTYLNTGMRRNELLNLQNKDIDRINNSIIIKGTKTKKSARKIITTKQIIDLIPKENKPFPYSPNVINKEFKTIVNKLKLNKQLTLHSLRHTFATRCLEKGINIKVVQKWLGHSSLKMTADLYSHIQEEMERKETEKL